MSAELVPIHPEPDRARALLLVEDNPGDARLVMEMLRRSTFGAFVVTHVTTLADAVAALAETRYACVLLDLSLPDADALEGLEAIREAHPVLPVVVLTGAVTQAAAYAALNGGAQDFLDKGEIDGNLLARALRYAVERGRVDAALLARDRQLSESHLLARIGTWEWDLDSDRMAWSPELYRVLGLPHADIALPGEAMLNLVHPADRPAADAAIARARVEGGRFSFQARVVVPSGVLCTSHVGEAQRGPRGRVTALFGTMQDVTHVQQAEAALRASERRYRTIVETAQEGVWMVDDANVTTFVNRRMAELLGYEPEEIVGRHLRTFMDNVAWTDSVLGLERTRRGESTQSDVRFRRRSGAPLHVIASTNPLWNDDGTYAGAIAMVNDITGRHYAEQRLRLDHDVVVALTTSSGIDEALYAVLRRTAPAVGSPFAEVWHRRPGERMLEPTPVYHAADTRFDALRACSEGARLAPGEDVVGAAWTTREVSVGPSSNDPERLAMAAACGLRGAYVMPVTANDAMLAVVVWHLPFEQPSPHEADLLDDVRKRLDEFALRWQVEQMKDVFLTAVSHELRTPLTSLIGHATTLQRHGPRLGDDLRDECVSGVVRSAAKLNVMLSDLLDVDRLARGVIEPRRHVVRLDDLVRSIVGGFDPDGDRTTLDLEECVARIDPPKVERIIENLLGNAAKYVPLGSRIEVRLTAEGEHAMLAVEDRGSGVPDELKTLVFEPFRRGEHLQSHAPGTGVGLSLVAGFARLHGGHAWVEDRAGGGSSFRVTLPLARQPVGVHDGVEAMP